MGSGNGCLNPFPGRLGAFRHLVTGNREFVVWNWRMPIFFGGGNRLILFLYCEIAVSAKSSPSVT